MKINAFDIGAVSLKTDSLEPVLNHALAAYLDEYDMTEQLKELFQSFVKYSNEWLCANLSGVVFSDIGVVLQLKNNKAALIAPNDENEDEDTHLITQYPETSNMFEF